MIFLGGGTENVKQIVIEPLRKVLSFSTENVKTFEYLGLDIIQNKKYDVSLSQTKFIDEIKKKLKSQETDQNKNI